MLDFLNSVVTSSIEKVRPEKFCIRAGVFLGADARNVSYRMCRIKIQIYRSSETSLALEFRRHGGDALVFDAIFRKACTYLQRLVQTSSNLRDIQAPLPFPPEVNSTLIPEYNVAEFLTPLLDMASRESQPSLQAEAAATLAEILERNKNIVDSLCTEEVFMAVRKLLHANDVAVLFPLARFLEQLASSPKAYVFLTGASFLEAFMCKIPAMSKCAIMSRPFAKILSTSLSRGASHIRVLPREVCVQLSSLVAEGALEIPGSDDWGKDLSNKVRDMDSANCSDRNGTAIICLAQGNGYTQARHEMSMDSLQGGGYSC
jgi:hypothetical protein